MSQDSEKILSDMHLALAQALLERVRNGEATASDLNVARQFLKDNQIQSLPSANKPMVDLMKIVPFPGDENALSA